MLRGVPVCFPDIGLCLAWIDDSRNILPCPAIPLLRQSSIYLKIFSVVVAIALLITHRKNIGRLLKGEESKLIKPAAEEINKPCN